LYYFYNYMTIKSFQIVNQFSFSLSLPIRFLLLYINFNRTYCYDMDVGKAIRDLRVKAGYSQDKLVAQTGISRSQLYFIESGRCVPRIETMEKIASVLNMRVSDIIIYAEAQYPSKSS